MSVHDVGIFNLFTANSLIHIIASYSFHTPIKRVFFRSFYGLRILLPSLLVCELHGSNSNVAALLHYVKAVIS